MNGVEHFCQEIRRTLSNIKILIACHVSLLFHYSGGLPRGDIIYDDIDVDGDA